MSPAPSPKPPSGRRAAIGDGAAFTVLLGDDLEAALRQMATLLELEGYTVLTATCASDVAQIVSREHIDAAAIDHFFPRPEDGLQAVRTIRGTLPNLPIILISAYNSTQAGIEVGRLNLVDGFLQKDEHFPNSLVVKLRDIAHTNAAMAEADAQILRLWRSVKLRRRPDSKGKALEELLMCIFDSVAGMEVVKSNLRTTTEEIDLFVRVGTEAGWPCDVNYVLVEAKNRKKPVSTQYCSALSLLRAREPNTARTCT